MMTNIFGHIFLISLKRRADRREQFFQSLKKTGLNWNVEVFDAMDGNILGCPESFKQVGAGAFGCWVSHLNLLTRATNEGWKNVLIFEDDALFVDDFADKLHASLEELPNDWDQFYLGFQPWNTDVAKPTVVSEHLWRVGDANRTHAYAINQRGYQSFLKHLYSYDKRPSGFHIDHWLGQLHRELGSDGRHVVNVYATRPQLVAQGEGRSDISNRINHINLWECKNSMEINNSMSGPVKIENSEVGYGSIGLNGSLGYESRRVNIPSSDKKDIFISAHAPAKIEIELDTAVEAYGAVNASGSPHVPISAMADGEQLGELSHANAVTARRYLKRGKHVLEFSTKDNRAAHSVFVIHPVGDPVLEILSNTACPRRCEGCNQREFMAMRPNYEYTADDAKALLAALEKADFYARVCLTGGEPALWSEAENVSSIFRSSKRITGMWVVSSDPTERTILRLKDLFGTVCLSKRNNTSSLIDSRPAWLEDVTVWDQREHAIPDSVPSVAAVECCCKGQGIRAALIGQTVYPCVLAESLSIAGKWSDCPRLSLDSYFQNDGFLKEIGTYDVCRTCVNNLCYRREAKKALT